MSTQVPTTTKAYVLGEKQTRTLADGKSIPYYDASLQERELPKAGEGDVVVKVAAAGFNHRELWIRKGQYPSIKVGSVLGADASAIIALLFCVARGANVFVSSSSAETIDKAIKLGAKGGVNYRDESWPRDLAALMKEHGASGLDAIIDSAGGDLLGKTGRILNHGAKVVCYGMTASPSIPLAMTHVLKNVELLGSTMGSTLELRAATDFAAQHKLRPVVSTVLDGLESAEKGFELLASGKEVSLLFVSVGWDEG
ncbi:hypothetical protein FS749_011614 [Ceratobasidium sp. UAMH 11750]|nr:hypothetical protein FS749_011614 [Ceratobasidium sp. UAMH 11750]